MNEDRDKLPLLSFSPVNEYRLTIAIFSGLQVGLHCAEAGREVDKPREAIFRGTCLIIRDCDQYSKFGPTFGPMSRAVL